MLRSDYATEIAAAFRLKTFIDQPRVNRFGIEHPLGKGFHALTKYMIKGRTTVAERQTIARLNVQADVIMRSLVGQGHDEDVRKHLCDTEKCRALLFEAHVAEFIISPNVRSFAWRRYVPGRSDFLTTDPMVQIECKLVTREATVQRVLEKAFDRVDQRAEGEGPFVLVAGADTPLDSDSIANVQASIGAKVNDWFGRHQEVAAVIAVLPAPVPAEERLRTSLGHRMLMFEYGSAVILRSNVSSVPLPPGFEFKAKGN
jgi:hypothetical protein